MYTCRSIWKRLLIIINWSKLAWYARSVSSPGVNMEHYLSGSLFVPAPLSSWFSYNVHVQNQQVCVMTFNFFKNSVSVHREMKDKQSLFHWQRWLQDGWLGKTFPFKGKLHLVVTERATMSAISNWSLLLLKQLFQVVEIILKEFATEHYTNSLEKNHKS